MFVYVSGKGKQTHTKELETGVYLLAYDWGRKVTFWCFEWTQQS